MKTTKFHFWLFLWHIFKVIVSTILFIAFLYYMVLIGSKGGLNAIFAIVFILVLIKWLLDYDKRREDIRRS